MRDCLTEDSWQKRALDFRDYEIKSISMPVRLQRALLMLGITDLRAVEGISEQELLDIRNFGSRSLEDLKEICGRYGIRIGIGTQIRAKP